MKIVYFFIFFRIMGLVELCLI